MPKTPLILLILLTSALPARGVNLAGARLGEIARAWVDSSAAALGWQEREVRCVSRPGDREAPSHRVYAEGPTGELRPGIVPVRLRDVNGRTLATIPVRVARFDSVLCAATALAKGSALGPDDVILARQERDARQLKALPNSMRTKRPLRRGETIRSTDIEPLPTIRAGETVHATLERGGLRLSLSARALEDAAAGELLRVHAPRLRRAVRARALGPGVARLEP